MSVSLHCDLVPLDDAHIRPDQHISIDVLVEVISSEMFVCGATAVGETRDDVGGAQVVGGFDSIDIAERAAAHLEERFEDDIDSLRVDEDTSDWAASQQLGLEPTRIGPWHIRGPWKTPPVDLDPRHDIVIDPGRAFGHGAHPSTILAIELLLRHLASPTPMGTTPRVFDIGSGTGVVAIVAQRCGAFVVAVESDDEAIEVAAENIRRNAEVSTDQLESEPMHRIELRHDDAATLVDVEPGDIVVANVTLDVHRLIAPRLAAASTVIVSGILSRQVAEVRATYPDHDAKTVRNHGEWASVVLIHPRQLDQPSRR